MIVSTKVDSTYPDYERWIPSEGPNVVTTSRVRLSESLARFAAVADPQAKTHALCLRWNADGLHLSAPDGSADFLAADVEGEHGAIMDAALARDADLAVRLHDAHITRTADIVTGMTAGLDTNQRHQKRRTR